MQNYKVFFNNNTLHIAKSKSTDIDFDSEIHNPDKENIRAMIEFLIKNDTSFYNYLIMADDIEQIWRDFNSLFNLHRAAGGVVMNKNNQILFIERNGLWDLPKGHVEGDETNEETAVREVMEECGIDEPKIIEEVCETYHTYILNNEYILKQTSWFLMSYSGRAVTKPQIEEGISKVVWFDNSKIDIAVKNTYLSIKQVIDCSNI
jgi:8-oxo-dGTP pyrophosphatase MutT (NUDIX family)